MTNGLPVRKHEAIDLPRASGSEIDSAPSSRDHATTPQNDARESVQPQTLLKGSIEDRPGAASCDEDDDSAGQSDENGKYTVPMSRVTSLSKTYTVEEEKAIIRKFDKRLVLFMALLYMLSFLDRSSQPFPVDSTTFPSLDISICQLLQCKY